MHRDGEKGVGGRGVLFSRISGVVGRGKFAPSTKRAFPSVYTPTREGSKAHGGAEFFGLHVALLGKLGIGNQPNIAKRHRECLNGQLTRVSRARAKVRFAIEDGEVGGLFSCFRHG